MTSFRKNKFRTIFERGQNSKLYNFHQFEIGTDPVNTDEANGNRFWPFELAEH